MSATSGIAVSQQLAEHFSSAKDIRFIKVVIQNESLVNEQSIATSGSFQEDLALLQDLLEDSTPAYILAKLDDADWLAIFYVPDSAKVRDKMLYASTRASLLKSLGSNMFSDSIFATSKADLTLDAYIAHRKHVTAPRPLSAREKEMEDVRAAEREAGGGYEGSRARASPIGTGVGLSATDQVQNEIKQLTGTNTSHLIIIQIDTSTETLTLSSSADTTIDSLASDLPPSDPCYALFAWDQPKQIIFIYSCPSTSPIKHRMLYSSASSGVYQSAKSLLSSGTGWTLASRKIETSDPTELTEDFVKSEIGVDSTSIESQNQKTFARPKGPARRK